MFAWMCRLFKKLKLETDAQPLSTMNKLEETLKKLEKKSEAYQKKASQQVKKGKEFTRAGNMTAASQCLEMKRLYEQQIKQLEKFQFRIKQLITNLEGVKATTETVDALKVGAVELEEMLKAGNIDDAPQAINGINEQMENIKQIQEALSTPIGAAADFDEDEFEAELKELEGTELEVQLHQLSACPASPVHVPTGPCPACLVPQRTVEEDELAPLQAEMAL